MGPKRSSDRHCSYCSLTLCSNPSLHAHIKGVHLKEKPFKCQYCKYSSIRKDRVAQHENRIHTRREKFKCPKPGCEFEAYSWHAVTKHASGHTPGQKRLKCPECPVRVPSQWDLKKHMMIHTGERPFSCNLCEYRANRQCHITRHLLTHTGEKAHKCPHCDYSCVTKSPLTVHIKAVHDRKYLHKCEALDCSFKTSNAASLRRHKIRIHGELKKNFKCSFCEQTFWTVTELDIHSRTHTGEKPYKCDLCPYLSSQLSNLKKHAARVHAKKSKG